jgi:hypothetical protein
MIKNTLFEQQLHDELLPGVKLMALIVIIGFASCVPLDYLIYPQSVWDMLGVRIVVIGVACLVMGVSFSPWARSRMVLRLLGYCNVLNAGVGLSCLTYVAGGSTCPYWTMNLVVFFGGVILQRFSILESMALYSSIIVFYCVLLLWSGEPVVTVSFLVSNVGQFIGMVIAVVSAGYLRALQIREFDIRSAFAEASIENKKVLEELGRSAWIKSHSADLATALQGIDSLPALARQLMTRLTPLLGAQVGVFYHFDRQAQCFSLLGSHGYKLRKGFNQQFRLGEGIVGQCAVERAPIMLSEVPDDYMHIASGLGQASPRFVLAAPVILPHGEIGAVLEVGFFSQPGGRERSLFDEVLPQIGISLSILENKQRVQP